MEHAAPAPEKTLPDLSFMEVESLESLREDETKAASKAREQLLSKFSLSDIVTRYEEVTQKLDERSQEEAAAKYENYLQKYLNRDADSELYDRLLDLLKQTAVTAMDSEKWYLGEKDDEGNHTKDDTSGQALIKRALAEIRGTEPTEPTPEDLTPQERKAQYKEAIGKLSEARAKLAKLSVMRRQKILNTSELEDQYIAAQKEYENLIILVGGMKVRRWHEEQGLTGDALRAQAVATLLDEHQAFSNEELKVLEADDSRRGKIARWLVGKKHRLSFVNAGSGIVIGFGAKWALGLLAGGIVGATGGAAAGAALAVRSTKALLMSKINNQVDAIRHFDERRDKDHALLRTTAEGHLEVSDHATMVAAANDMLQNLLDSRVKQDRNGNARRLGKAMLIGTGAGLVGVGLEFGAEHIGLPSLHSLTHHSPGAKGGPAPNPTHPHGGGTPKVNYNDTIPPNQNPPLPANQPYQLPHTGGGHAGGVPQKPGIVDGYQTNVHIAHGEGYQQAINELAAQKHLHLTNAQSWQLYEHLNDKFHGHFLTNDPSYHMPNPGEWGISHAGTAHWNPAVIHEMNHWLIQNGHQDKLTAITKTTKKVAKHATKATMAHATSRAA